MSKKSFQSPYWLIIAISSALFLMLIFLLWKTVFYNEDFTLFIHLVWWISYAILLGVWITYLTSNKKLTELSFYDIGKNLTKILGLTALVIPLYIAWQTLKLNYENNRQTLVANREKAEDENFIRANAMLGDSNIGVRISAIYLLERLARNNPEQYYWPVAHAFTAYIRRYSPADVKHPHAKPPTVDINIILDFLKDGPYAVPHYWEDRINLEGVDISFASLAGARFTDAVFDNAIMVAIDLNNAQLEQASLINTNLSHAMLFNTNLIQATLYDADLREAELQMANLSGASLAGAKFNNSLLQLIDANFIQADFINKYNSYIHNIEKVPATGLSCNNLKHTKISKGTLLPPMMENCELNRLPDPMDEVLKKMIKDKSINAAAVSVMKGRLIYRYVPQQNY